jgi:hypothetical protein
LNRGLSSSGGLDAKHIRAFPPFPLCHLPFAIM